LPSLGFRATLRRMKRAISASVAFLALLAGCSSSSSGAAANQGPVIDSVQAAATTAAGAQWQMTITFHDPEKDAVQDIHFTMKDLNQDLTTAAQGQTANAVGIIAAISFPANTPKGAHAYTVSLIDSKGAEGAVYSGTVTVN
jgi:hypothetical protein